MFGDGALTFREFAMREPLPLATTFPELKNVEGPVVERLRANGATEDVLTAWENLVAQEIVPDDEDGEFARDDEDDE
jgi:hypothetical protein